MPYINSHYRTLTDASHTGIGGSSYGALVSVYVVATHAGVFGRLLAESPTLGGYGSEMLREAEATRTWPNRVYLGVGTNEVGAPSCNPASPPSEGKAMVDDVQSLASILGRAGLDSSRLRVVIAPCATHTHAAWAARLPDALTFLFRKP